MSLRFASLNVERWRLSVERLAFRPNIGGWALGVGRFLS
jgi:hypothetical protein